MTGKSTFPACRAFEEALEHSLFTGNGISDSSSPHFSECADCQALMAQLEALRELVSQIRVPVPSAQLLENLRAIPEVCDAPVWKETTEVLSFLTPGALPPPPFSPSLRARILAISAPPGKREEPLPAGVIAFPQKKGRRFPLLRDWRVAVALVYAATLVVVTGLRWDPTTVARRAASDLTNSGEHAILEAREEASRRLAESLKLNRSRPLRDQVDYRIYRALAVSKAKATAYTGLVLEKVFGRREPEERVVHRSSEQRSSGSNTEPDPHDFRS